VTSGAGQRSRPPLDDTSRRRLFLAALVVIALAAALALLDHHPPPASETPPPAAAAAMAAAPTVPSGATPISTAPHQRNASPKAGGLRSDVAAALRAARRFLAGYLPYSYGRGSARKIVAITGALRHQLGVQAPRVPRRERRRRPRVRLLQTDAVHDRDASVRALIGDGARAYTVELHVVRRRAGRWRVGDVGA
jgi:hypothetical protein